MTQDRFSAQLRQHLLESANERPADGQLAAVIDGVDATRQRHPLVARLTWTPGRIGTLPTAAIRYGLIAAALALATVAGAILAGGGGSRSTVFEGTWTAIDPADGSGMTLVVGRGQTPAVYFEDGYATGAACVNDVVKRFTARGTGEISGNRLVASFPDGGGCGLLTVEVAGRYDYLPGRDTLIDQDDLIWARPLGETPPPRAPVTSPESPAQSSVSPTSEATPGPTLANPTGAVACIDLAHGGTYTGPAGPLTVTATVPEEPAIPWQGMADRFHLSSRCEDGASPSISFFASTATDVPADSCLPYSTEIASFADAVARLDTPTGDDISKRVDLTIGGHAAARYDITSLSTCPGFGLWNGTILGTGETGSIYVIDVDGVLMAIELNRDGSQTQAELEEAHAIIASLQIAN